MPIHEYTCRHCGHAFERLLRGDEAATCPACESRELERQLSTFAVSTATAASAAPEPMPTACGRCGDPRGPGACSLPEA